MDHPLPANCQYHEDSGMQPEQQAQPEVAGPNSQDWALATLVLETFDLVKLVLVTLVVDTLELVTLVLGTLVLVTLVAGIQVVVI